MEDKSDNTNYQYPAFWVKQCGQLYALMVFPRLYKEGAGYLIPPLVESRIELICKALGHSEEDVLLVALNRQLEEGCWQGVIKTAAEQNKVLIAVATDCAERAERAVTQIRNELKSTISPLTGLGEN